MTLETLIIEFVKLSVAATFGFMLAAALMVIRDQDNN